MISTSFMTGTGFMKCIPITDSGRLVTGPNSVMLIELVLVAMIVPRAEHASSSWRHERLLELDVLGCGLDDEVRLRQTRPPPSTGSMRRAISSRASDASACPSRPHARAILAILALPASARGLVHIRQQARCGRFGRRPGRSRRPSVRRPTRQRTLIDAMSLMAVDSLFESVVAPSGATALRRRRCTARPRRAACRSARNHGVDQRGQIAGAGGTRSGGRSRPRHRAR